MKAKAYNPVVFHILAWVLFISIPILLHRPSHPDHGAAHERGFLGMPELVSYITLIGFFYLNAYYFIPAFLSKKKMLAYVSLTLFGLLFITAGNGIIAHMYYPFHRSFMRSFTQKLFPGLFIFAISLSYRVIIDNARLEQLSKEKENENLKTELTFLKSQVSPHFMFNVLNNMVSLARKKSDRLEPILMELSGLMRYMLYESGTEKVSLEKEIEYLKSYINLQLLRFGEDVRVNFNIQEPLENNSIEPMLFIPLVENAFKHGLGIIEKPEIDIQLSSRENTVFMRVVNAFNKDARMEKKSNSGIGLTNLERRLNLLYPGRHELIVSENGNQFIAALKLNLK